MGTSVADNYLNEVINKKKSWLNTAKRHGIKISEAIDIIKDNGYQKEILQRYGDLPEAVIKLFDSGLGVNDICSELRMTDKNKITGILRLSGYEVLPNFHKGRESKIDHHYFDVIDTEAKAYFLGFLYADGHNSYKTNKYQVRLSLQAEDEHILEDFKQELKSSGEIKSLFAKSSKSNKVTEQKVFAFYSKDLSLTLKKLGCTEQKTHEVDFPSEDIVPDHLVRHFIRGYLDGDGSIYVNEDKYTNAISINGTREILEGIQDIFVSKLGITPVKIYDGNGKVHDWKKGGRTQVLKILDWLYEDATFYLKRKHDKYIQIKNLKRKDYTNRNMKKGRS